MRVEVENECPGSAGSEFDGERARLRDYRLYSVTKERQERRGKGRKRMV